MANQTIDSTCQLVTADFALPKHTLASMSDNLAHYLLTQGVCRSDHVVVITDKLPGVFVSASACFSAGLVLVPLDPTLSHEQICAVIERVKPKAILADLNILEKLGSSVVRMASVVLDTSSSSSRRGWLRARKNSNWTTLYAVCSHTLPKADPEHKNLTIDDQQAAYVMFTSGSTDKPKGVVVSRAALKKHVNTLSGVLGYTDESKLLCFLPSYHTDGLVHCIYVPLLKNMSVIHPGAFKVSTDFRRLGEISGVTHFLAVPTILSMLHEFYSDDPKLFSSLGINTVISTAGLLDKNLWQKFETTFNTKLLNFYGLTETISGAIYCDSHNHCIGSVGKPVGLEARLIADGKEVVDSSTPGELQLRGEQLMSGYFQDSLATANAFQRSWFKTGDIFTKDENGYYYFQARIKEVIKKGGITIYPREIRQQLNKINEVYESEVIGIPDTIFEEIIVACIASSHPLNQSDLRHYCETALPKEMRPDHFVFLDNLPKTAVGKTNKPALLSKIEKQLRTQKLQNPGQQSVDPVQATVISIAAEVFNATESEPRIQMGKDQISGWDSYAHIRFIRQIENAYDVRFKAREIMKIANLEQVVACVKSHLEKEKAA